MIELGLGNEGEKQVRYLKITTDTVHRRVIRIETPDGQQVSGVCALDIRMRPNDAVRATAELMVGQLELEAEASYSAKHPITGQVKRLARLEFEDGDVVELGDAKATPSVGGGAVPEGWRLVPVGEPTYPDLKRLVAEIVVHFGFQGTTVQPSHWYGDQSDWLTDKLLPFTLQALHAHKQDVAAPAAPEPAEGGSGAVERIPADKEHVIALAIHHAQNGNSGLLERLKAEVAAAPEPAAGGGREIVRHLKSGGQYEVLGEAGLQISVGTGCSPTGNCIHEDDRLVIYRGADGRMWAREESEFRDGRFETISAPSETETETAGGDGWQDIASVPEGVEVVVRGGKTVFGAGPRGSSITVVDDRADLYRPDGTLRPSSPTMWHRAPAPPTPATAGAEGGQA